MASLSCLRFEQCETPDATIPTESVVDSNDLHASVVKDPVPLLPDLCAPRGRRVYAWVVLAAFFGLAWLSFFDTQARITAAVLDRMDSSEANVTAVQNYDLLSRARYLRWTNRVSYQVWHRRPYPIAVTVRLRGVGVIDLRQWIVVSNIMQNKGCNSGLYENGQRVTETRIAALLQDSDTAGTVRI